MIEVQERKIKTNRKFSIIDITNEIKNYITSKKIGDGQITITTKHTTAVIRINENEERLLLDIEQFLKEIVPEGRNYLHDDIEKRKNCPKNEPKNACAHLRALLMGASETIPIKNGELVLGKWQRIFFIELDGPRKRTFSTIIIAN